jgi:hypothetical protein
MHRLLLSILLIAGFCGLAAIPYAKVWSTETLFPSSTPFATFSKTPVPFFYEWFQHDEIKPDILPTQITSKDVDDTLQPQAVNGTVSEQPIDTEDDSKHSDRHLYGLYVPAGETDEHTLVRRSNVLVKQGVFRGTIQMDCRIAPMVRKNAGYYQNCLRGARGNYKLVTYTNGPNEDSPYPEARKNRYNSGVSTGWATPCNARPFCQISYDRWLDDLNNPVYNEEVGLQTDELADGDHEDRTLQQPVAYVAVGSGLFEMHGQREQQCRFMIDIAPDTASIKGGSGERPCSQQLSLTGNQEIDDRYSPRYHLMCRVIQ